MGVSHVKKETDVSCRALTAGGDISQQQNNIKKGMYIHRVIQKKRSIFWRVIVSVIVREKVHVNMWLILNG